MPFCLRAAESPMCDEGKRPPLTNSTLTPNNTIDRPTTATLNKTNFIGLVDFWSANIKKDCENICTLTILFCNLEVE